MGNKGGKEETKDGGKQAKAVTDNDGARVLKKPSVKATKSTGESIPSSRPRREERTTEITIQQKEERRQSGDSMPPSSRPVSSPMDHGKTFVQGREKVVKVAIQHDKLVVAAIDFGTYGSGFALCTRADYQKNQNKIYVHTWNSGTAVTNKAPTSVLLKPNGKDCMSFGYDADRDYVDLEPQEQKSHYLFRQFKMKLFKDKTLSETTKLKDFTEKELCAVDVFASVIRFFKEKLQERLSTKDTQHGFTYEDVYWVITVPAIWDLKAKQFMRKAAEKAGLKDNQLSLALEPEAASLYCRKVPVEIATMRDGDKQIASLPAGSKYLVLDLGGGTIDITAHEVTDDGGLMEMHQASGGYYGGTCVNDDILTFMKKLVGMDVITQVKDEAPGDWLDLCNEIEMKKCTFGPKMNKDKISLRIPVTLIDAYRDITGCELEESLDGTDFASDVHIKRDKMSISSALFEKFFRNSLDNVVKIIREIFDNPTMSGVDTLLAVGGYAESSLMVDTLKKAFSHKKVVIPTDPSLAILKGAVIYGYEPEIIASRVCRYTYGIAKQGVFKQGDPESKKLPYTTKRGLPWVDDVFDKHVEVGQVVKVGEFQKAQEYFATPGQTMALLDFYASTEKNPRFVDEPSCQNVGSLILELDGRDERVNIHVQISVGGTELEIEAKDQKTNKVFKTYCNFLP